MKYTIIIPVYLSRKNNEWNKGDVVYDHPTAINTSGTLASTLESLEVIKNEKFDVVLLISTTTKDIDNKVDSWIKVQISKARYCPENLYIFTQTDLGNLFKIFSSKDKNFGNFLSLQNYPQVRNCCLTIGVINKSDAIIFLDDDELVRDMKFIQKIDQGLNKKIGKEKIRFITGMCPEGETGSYIRVRKYSPWMKYWDKIKFQNETLFKVIDGRPRFKLSPLTHGGLSVIHKDIFFQIPFDPNVKRGEDMDFNMNCRMFGYKCYMDNQLEIRHCPPSRVHPAWRRFREDMVRFLIQRNKIKNQNKKSLAKVIIKVKDFDPYPGKFLQDDLEDMIFKSQLALAIEYLSKDELVSMRETLGNINIAIDFLDSRDDYFDQYMKIVKNWRKFTQKLSRINMSLRKL